MAEIVKARDTSRPDDRIVAIKRILPHLCGDQHYRAMFLDESRVLTQLDHPSIIKAYEIGEIEGTPYIALEHIQGQDARELFHVCQRRSEPQPLDLACTLIARVCEGLQHAHEQKDEQGQSLGIVHRDVSLQNILIGYDGDVKLTDFGIAVSSENESRTEAGVVKGKFGYMSPEQIRGTTLDRRSDVFAVGICLYELLTAERLFSGENDYKALERVQKVDIQAPSAINRQIPSSLERIVLKALARQPRDRYQSTNDLRRALQAFMVEAKLFATREDLGLYMQRVFADEYAAVEQEAAERRELDKSSHVTAVSVLPAAALFDESDRTTVAGSAEYPGQVRDAWAGVPDAATGLSAFEHVPPVQPFAAPADPDAPSSPDAHTHVTVPSGPERFDMDWDEHEPTTVSRGFEHAEPVHPPSSPLPAALASHIASPPPVSPAPVLELPRMRTRAASEAAMRSLPTLELRRPTESRFTTIAIAVVLAAVVAGLTVLLLRHRATGGLRVETEPPDCVVRVDGRRIAGERSPFVVTDLSTRHKHTVVVERSGYTSWSTTLRLVPDQLFALPPVRLTAVHPPPELSPPEPPSEAQEPAQPPPAVAPAKSGRRPGSANRAARSSQEPSSTEARPAPTARATKSQPAAGSGTGTLRLNTRPWSRISIDGVPRGNTPQMNLQLSAGTHTITLSNPEFGLTKELVVTIKPGETVTRVLTLGP